MINRKIRVKTCPICNRRFYIEGLGNHIAGHSRQRKKIGISLEQQKKELQEKTKTIKHIENIILKHCWDDIDSDIQAEAIYNAGYRIR